MLLFGKLGGGLAFFANVFRTKEGDAVSDEVKIHQNGLGFSTHTDARVSFQPQGNSSKSTLNDLRDAAYTNSKEHGFHDEPKSMGDYIALIHSELSEALEDFRNGNPPTKVWYEIKGHGLFFSNTQYEEQSSGDLTIGDGPRKPCGIPSEMADVIIRVLDFCGAHGIDIDKAVTEKMAYNKTRPHKHGKKI
jgi:NTP pyrophosphatase (non-canonical NTP hydrolase)